MRNMYDPPDDLELEAFARTLPTRFSPMVERRLQIARAKIKAISTSDEPTVLYKEIKIILKEINCGFRALDIDGNMCEENAKDSVKLIVAERHKELARFALAALCAMEKPYNVYELSDLIQHHRQAAKWTYREIGLKGGKIEFIERVSKAKELRKKRQNEPDVKFAFNPPSHRNMQIKLAILALSRHSSDHTHH